MEIIPNSVKPDFPFACTTKLYKLSLSIRRQILKRDSQIIGLFWGTAGSGKSLLAMKLGYLVLMSPLRLDQIAFDKMQYIGAVLTTRQGYIQGDEGISLFHAKEAMRTEGVLMQQLIDQIRQKNLFTNILMVDILDANKIILDRLNFACHVWESRELVKDKDGKPLRDSDGERVYKTIKGNYALYPKLKSHDYLTPLLSYLYLKRQKRTNPLIRLPAPPPAWDRSGGSEYKPNGYHGFYPPGINEAEYRAKKETILEKYRKKFERKPRNNQIDYFTMDKLIKAKVKQVDIAKHLNVSTKTVKIRAALLRGNRKSKKNTKYRQKATK